MTVHIRLAPRLSQRRTIDEWEAEIGVQIRRLRVQSELTIDELARLADLSPGAVKNLERGRGHLSSLIRVTRVLGREAWLEGLGPPKESVFDPMALLKERRAEAVVQRVRPRP